MITEILLDIDDVCNQCTKSALQWLNVPMDYDNFEATYPRVFGYDIVSVANHLTGYNRFTVPSFWSMIPRVFWASCPVSEEFHWLLAQCEKLVGRENIIFLTSPTKDPDCLAGKLEWIIKTAPSWMHRQYSICTRKRIAANSESLLIDDSDTNVNVFRATRNGNAILVPRPWNTLHAVDTKAHVQRELNRMFFAETK